MSLISELRRRARHIVGPTLGALLVLYFVSHAFEGDRGALAWVQLNQRIAQAAEDLEGTGVKRRELAKRVSQLRAGSLDPDLLDERARIMAGLGHPSELMVYYPPEE
jgi:cell division protein FtsB